MACHRLELCIGIGLTRSGLVLCVQSQQREVERIVYEKEIEMRKSIVVAAVAGLASAASAQTASLSIVASQTVVNSAVTTSITLAIYADADFGTHVTGAAFTLGATGGAGVVDGMALGSVAAWGGLGEDDLLDGGDGNYNGVIMGQIVFLPFIQPDAASALGAGPVLIANMNVTIAAGSSGVIDWTVGGGIGTFALELIDVNANPGDNPPGETFQIAAPNFGSEQVTVIIPAPSAMALLGLGGLVAGRRRR